MHLLCRILLVAFFCLVPASKSSSVDLPPRPNILFFLADNWAWPHASVLGDATAKTPVFDRIAREGVLFNHAFCPVPSCSPTRSCILTGRAAHQLEEAASLWSAFPGKFAVFTRQLQDAGYEVGFSGKGWSPGRYEEFGWSENPVGKLYKNFSEFMLQHDASKPFFFWSGNTDTALNKWNHEPEGWADLDPKTVSVPLELPDSEDVRLSMLAYYGGVGRIDADAGRCIAELEQRNLLDDTLFVYTSDNGWQMPRGLANCYDSGTRIPMAIRWGKNLAAGQRTNEFVSLTDLAPTFLQLVGLKIPDVMTGQSFVDVLLDQPSHIKRDHVFLERERHANVRQGNLSYPIRGIRTKEFLYLWNLRPERWPAGDPKVHFAVGDYGDVDNSKAKLFMLANSSNPAVAPFFELNFGKRPAEELYDLSKDPQQIHNLAGIPEYAASQKMLRAQVEQWMRDTTDPRVHPNFNEWDNYPYFGPPIVEMRENQRKPKARTPNP
jgi:N-sulfoglucosamine sulfohydrolase